MVLPTLYKLILKTEAEDREDLVRYCLDNSVIGMGWGTNYLAGVASDGFAEYFEAAVAKWSRRSMSSSRAFHDAENGSLVWFRDLTGAYYLASLVGPWKLMTGATARRLDLGQIRNMNCCRVGSEAEVPGAVLRAFAGRGQTFCRVPDHSARAYSAMLAHELLGAPSLQADVSSHNVLRSLLGPLDVEDLVAAYLQVRRAYMALPARYTKSTAVYEYVLRSRKDGHIAAVQVKTGNALVPVDSLDPTVAEKWYVYSHTTQDLPSFVERITDQDLLAFMADPTATLPPVTERWLTTSGG